MARKIAFINYKGGVGKTSLIVNTAACLAKQGKRVLLCDFDTQSNASIWLLRLDRWNKINATGDGAIYSIFDPGKVQLKDIIIKDVVEGKAGEKLLPGLDLAPTTFNLVDLENEYTGDPSGRPMSSLPSSSPRSTRATTSSSLTARRIFCAPRSAASFRPTKSMCRRTPTR